MPTNRAVHDLLVPAAGLGTRMLPATRALPKELLPLVDRDLRDSVFTPQPAVSTLRASPLVRWLISAGDLP